MRILASAPAKVILFGEHYVVYGAPGLVAAIEPYNEMELDAKGSASPGLEYRSTIKENDVTVELLDSPASSALRPSAPVHPYAALYRKLADELPRLQKLSVRAEVKSAWPLKGVGNSASLGAALAAGLRALAGEKNITAEALFLDAQAADEVAHGGGRPSGIDAAAAAYGRVMEFSKNFDKTDEPRIRPLKIAPMKDAGFILIDTLKAQEKRGNTADLISAFAKSNGINKKPGEMSRSERAKIFDAYLPIQMHAARALEQGHWETVGLLMDENHKLVSRHGVSSPGIERAVAVCKSYGALGAKLSGAGGVGGVVIALARKKDIGRIQEALRVGGFMTYPFKLSEKGARATKID